MTEDVASMVHERNWRERRRWKGVLVLSVPTPLTKAAHVARTFLLPPQFRLPDKLNRTRGIGHARDKSSLLTTLIVLPGGSATDCVYGTPSR